MKNLTTSPSFSHLLMFLWALVAVGGIVWCLCILLRPKTNQTCIVGMLIFCVGWLIECLAHSMVMLSQWSPALLLWGVSISCVCFAGGFITAVIGLVIHLRNEHRYEHGFAVGLLAFALNGWVAARATTMWLGGKSDELARGIILPMLGHGHPLLGGLSPSQQSQSSGREFDPARGYGAAGELAGELTASLNAQGEGDWRRMPTADASMLQSLHPAAQVLLFSSDGPSWLSLSIERMPKLSATQLPELSEAGAARVLDLALDQYRRGAHRVSMAGFECSRLRYVAVVPCLPGAHGFDQWMAAGNGWLVEMLLWSPSVGTQKFDTRSLPVVKTMLHVAAERGLSTMRRPPAAEELFQRGLSDWVGGDTAGAIALWTRAAARAPGDIEIALAVAQAQEHHQRADLAIQFLDARQLLLSASPVVAAARAHLELRLEHFARAITGFAPLFEGGYSDDSSLHDYLTALSRSGEISQAVTVLEKLAPRHGRAVVEEWRQTLTPKKSAGAPRSAPGPSAISSSGPTSESPGG